MKISVKCADSKIISKEVLERLGMVIPKQLNIMCRRSSTCVLGEKSKDIVATFSWDKLIKRKLLQHQWWKKRLPNTDVLVSIVVAIILRIGSQKLNFIQRIVSVVLYAGHASKRISAWASVKVIVYIIMYTNTKKFNLKFRSLNAYRIYTCVYIT